MISLLFKYSGSAVSQLFAETQYWVTVSEFCEPISSGNRATYLPVGASIRWRQQSCKLHILSVIKCIADTPRSVRSLTRSLARSLVPLRTYYLLPWNLCVFHGYGDPTKNVQCRSFCAFVTCCTPRFLVFFP